MCTQTQMPISGKARDGRISSHRDTRENGCAGGHGFTARDLLAAFGEALGRRILRFDERRECRILTGAYDYTLIFSLEDEGSALAARVEYGDGEYAGAGRAELLPYLLRINGILGHGERGAFQAAGDDNDRLAFAIHIRVAEVRDIEEFVDLISGFVRAAEEWRLRLNAGNRRLGGVPG